MTFTAEDLFYFANVLHDIASYGKDLNDVSRYREATEYLKKAVQINPTLSKKNQTYFGIIYKDAIDLFRNTLRHLQTEEEQSPSYALDLIQLSIKKATAELSSLCESALYLINDFLLPNAEDAYSKTFYNKMKGDMFRYLYEFADSGQKEIMRNAEESYKAAIQIATTDLNSQDPVRLGTILNYSVFVYEHMKNKTEAVKLLKDALYQAQNETKILPDDGSKNESLTIIQVMQTNLSNWVPESPLGSDEEEDIDGPEDEQ